MIFIQVVSIILITIFLIVLVNRKTRFLNNLVNKNVNEYFVNANNTNNTNSTNSTNTNTNNKDSSNENKLKI